MVQELVARISKLGVDYDQAHAKDMERLEKSNAPCMTLLGHQDKRNLLQGLRACLGKAQGTAGPSKCQLSVHVSVPSAARSNIHSPI